MGAPSDYMYRIGDSEPFSIFSAYNIVGTVGCGFWFLAYAFIILQSHRDKATGMPLLPLCLNFGWELLGSFVWENPIPLWRWFYRTWLVLDVAIFVQAWLYGQRLQPIAKVRRHFHLLLVGTLAFATFGQWAFTRTFYDPMGFITAFAINLVMSARFIGLYFERPDGRGLSYPAAWFKMLGTLCTAIECHYFLPVIHPQKGSFLFPHFLYVSIFILDVLSISLLHSAPWRKGTQVGHPTLAPED
jgi:hypothetical protein